MVDAAPFRALRHDPAVAGDPLATSAPAADDIDRFDRARHRTANPYTVLELLARGAGDEYEEARAALWRWWRTGVLIRDERPGLYAYEQRTAGGEAQRGILAAVTVGPPQRARILPHEDVDRERVEARVSRLLAVPADLAPVLALTSPLGPSFSPLLAAVLRRPPLVELTDEAGTAHRVVAVTAPDEIAELRALLAPATAVIADGHHRYASALALRARRSHDPLAARTLMLLADPASPGTRVLPVHRLLRSALPDAWRARLPAGFTATALPGGADELVATLEREPPGTVALLLPAGGFLLRPKDLGELRGLLPPGTSPTWRTLDTALVDHVLLPALGVGPGAVGYLADPGSSAELLRERAAAVVLVRPVTVATVAALAMAGERMPPKTSSFRPKPRTGLIMRARWE